MKVTPKTCCRLIAARVSLIAAFPLLLLKTVFLYYKAPLVSIHYDDETIELPALMVSIMNGQRMGGGFFMAPDGKPDDHLLDLCIAREVGRLQIFVLVTYFMKGTQATQEPIRMERARKVVVEAIKGVLPAHADGETICIEGKRLEIELLPGQIEMVTRVS